MTAEQIAVEEKFKVFATRCKTCRLLKQVVG